MTGEDGLPELESRPQGRREWSGYLRSLVLPLAFVVAVVLGLLWWQSARGSDDSAGGYGTMALPVEKNATGKSASPDEGRAAPDFTLQTLDGSAVRLSDLQGHPVLINFWASWCVSCRAETPNLISAYNANKTDGLMVLAVDLREATDRVKPFVTEFGMPYPVLLDRAGQVARTWRIGGPMQGLPSSYFVDRQGVVRKVIYGQMSDKTLSDGLASIMKAGS